MLWLMVLASLLGFLAVTPLANHLFTISQNPQIWIFVSIINLLCFFTSLIIYLYRQNYFGNVQPKISAATFFLNLWLQCFCFIWLCLASCSYGLSQYLIYQNRLLQQPMTITAKVRATQISDNISKQFFANNQSSPFFTIGNQNQRQVWQIEQIYPFANDTISDNINKKLKYHLPMQVLVNANVHQHPEWQNLLNQLTPNQTFTVKLALQPILQTNHDDLIPNLQPIAMGFDESLWLRQRNIQAKAKLLTIDNHSIQTDDNANFAINIEQLRWQFRQKLLQPLQQQILVNGENHQKSHDNLNASAILLGLLTGDRGLMSPSLKHWYQVTGISHLLAISGPHVTMLASILSVIGLFFVKLLLPNLLLKIPSRLLILWIATLSSGFYAMLVGFELPAQRTFLMLLLVTLSLQLLIRLSAWQVLAWVALFMMWLDTTAVTQAGFWLSFVAVALLMNFSQSFAHFDTLNGLDHQPKTSWIGLIWHSVKQLFWLQLWLFIMMLPVVVWFFGKVSLIGILVNLLAVPFLGLFIVPLNMLAGVLSWLPLVGDFFSQKLWQLLSNVLILFHHFLQFLLTKGLAKSWYLSFSSQQIFIFIFIAIIWWLKGILPRLLILPLLLWIFLLNQTNHHLENAKLILLQYQPLNIHLLIAGDDTWLILADHQSPKSKMLPKTKPSLTNSDILENQIYPILAKQNIHALTGVISQTNSQPVNDLIQILAKNVSISHYWLAGFDASKPNQNWHFPHLQPKPCQAGQVWQQNALTLSALTGWQLKLPPNAIDIQQRWQTQTCLLQIDIQFQQQIFSAMLMAGDSLLPLQMSEKMCLLKPVDLLVMSYQTPIYSHWLTLTKPKAIHLINTAQPLKESTESAFTNLPIKISKSTQTGDVSYQFW